MLQNHSDDLLNFCAIYEEQNADNARTLKTIWWQTPWFIQQTTSSL